jgi:hypothetical protein
MTALQYFRLLAPEFASVSDEIVNQWLGMAALLINVGCLDAERAAMATALYAAHMLALSNRSSGGNSGSGVLKREKEGDLEREYAVTDKDSTYLGQTVYGQQYLSITLGCFGSAIMTRGPSCV